MGSFDFTLVTGLGAVTALVFVWWGLRKSGALGKAWKGHPTRQITVLIFGALMILPVCKDDPIVADSNTGSLAVTSDPQGAKIFLDADTLVKGETPDTITCLPVGDHDLKLTHDLCEDWDSTVTISSNDVSTVHADLVMTIGQIFADSDPQGAWIFLDGESIGTVTPDTLDTVGIGEHEIKLTLFCHSDCGVCQ